MQLPDIPAGIKSRKTSACWFAEVAGIPLDTPVGVVNTGNDLKLYISSTAYVSRATAEALLADPSLSQGCGCHAQLCPCSLGAFGFGSPGWQRHVCRGEKHMDQL